MNIKTILIISLLVLITVTLFYLMLIPSHKKSSTIKENIPIFVKPSSTPVKYIDRNLLPDVNPEYIKSAEEIIKKEAANFEESENIVNMRKKLPYHGDNFSFYYDYTVGKFILTLNKDKTQEGQVEFEQFLKEKAVNKDLLQIETKYE